jgi:rubrerythrin
LTNEKHRAIIRYIPVKESHPFKGGLVMETEHNKTIEALQTAVQMEIDGKEFYLKASRESSNELGKKLLQSLAKEEDNHRRKFEEIYSAIASKKDWPKTDFQPDGGKNLRTIFARETEKMSSGKKPIPTELDAVQKAMDLENKTHDFYKTRSENASQNAEIDFYQTVAAEEKEHYLILLDYYEYLKDPAAWFVGKEHPSLDGG